MLFYVSAINGKHCDIIIFSFILIFLSKQSKGFDEKSLGNFNGYILISLK